MPARNVISEPYDILQQQRFTGKLKEFLGALIKDISKI